MTNADQSSLKPAVELLWNGSRESQITIALAHGAGQPMDAPYMETVAVGLAAEGYAVVRFEFPYMARRRVTGRKAGPDRGPVLLETWRHVIEEVASSRLIIGGKSMGGRIASMIADDAGVGGLVCLGYPFHPPGKPEKLRTAHLAELRTPTLICQGERDPFGTREDVGAYELSSQIQLQWLPDGDHGLKPRKKSGRTEAENLADAIAGIAAFGRSLKFT